MLYVLRIMVASPNNDEVFEPAGYEQLSVVQKSKVTGPQKRSLASVLQVRPKSLLCLLRPVPVTLGNAGTRHPELSYPIGWTPGQRFVIDHGNFLVTQCLATPYQRPGILVLGGSYEQPIALEPRSFDREHDGRGCLRTAGSDQGCFREPVGGIKRLPAKAAGRKGRRETLQSLLSDRLGTIESHRPAAKVEGRPLLGGDLAGTEIVGEIRSASSIGSQPRDGSQPPEGTLQKGNRRHKRSRESAVQGLQYPPNQPHIVVRRQPAHHMAVRRVPKATINHGQVV